MVWLCMRVSIASSLHDNARRVPVLFPKNLNASLNLVGLLLLLRLFTEVKPHILFQVFVDVLCWGSEHTDGRDEKGRKRSAHLGQRP